MNDEIPNNIVALYRAGATEEPSATLDEAILEAACRRIFPHPAAIVALAAVMVLAVLAHTHHPSVDGPEPATAAAQPAALDAGRERYLAIDATAQAPAMHARPASYQGEVK